MLPEITIFNFGTLEVIDLSLLIRKVKFLWGWACQTLGRKKLTNWTKLENAQFPRALKEDIYHLSLNDKTTPHFTILTQNTLSDLKIEPEN